MESIINHQLMNYLEARSLLSRRQYGFRRGLGTADLLTALQFERTQAMGSGGCAQALTADIAGAFDKVSHLGVLHKMREMCDTGLALSWLHDYLSKRHLQVNVGGRCSSLFPVRADVPHWSIIGPTLFLVCMYVNDANKLFLFIFYFLHEPQPVKMHYIRDERGDEALTLYRPMGLGFPAVRTRQEGKEKDIWEAVRRQFGN